MLSRLTPKLLPVLLIVYMTVSLIHFVHNAEFLAEYPNLPTAWTRSGVYLAWIAMTVVGLTGWTLLSLGYRLFGLLLLAVYAALGLDSLGHYVVAPFSAHTEIMNSTILLEVTAAALVLLAVLQQFKQQVQAPDDIS
ncbi:MAG: hypothetical protein ACFB14_07070 [Leptolyngbyaceae cyanobacterium]